MFVGREKKKKERWISCVEETRWKWKKAHRLYSAELEEEYEELHNRMDTKLVEVDLDRLTEKRNRV